MKKSTYILISLLLLVMYCSTPSVTYALDAPHNDVDAVYCSNCHYPSGSTPAWSTAPTTTISTPLNELCAVCHNSGNLAIPSKFADVKTHSSFETGGATGAAYPFLIECRACHSPHTQDQMRGNGSLGNLASGTNTSITASVLTDSSKNWTVNQFVDTLLVPNTTYIAYSYRIVSNTPTTITVEGTMKTAYPYTYVGANYAIKYGKLIKAAVVNQDGNTASVKFLNNSGPNSFATSTTVLNGICQACHTHTASFNTVGTPLAGPSHVQNAQGTNCANCHSHQYGFKGGGCNGCHGMSGATGAPIVAADLVTPLTGHNEGKHGKHVGSLGQGCEMCHAGNTMPALDSVITMSFSGAASGGTYSGIAFSGSYSYSAGVTIGATQRCSNIACHSTVQSGANGTGAPNYIPVNWSVSTPALNCGSCHIDMSTTGLTTGSHPKHVTSASIPCASCHTGYTASTTNGSLHANAHINVAPGTGSYSTDDHAPRGGYGTCSATYCHGTPATAAWGTTGLTCVSCHDATSALAQRHDKHFSTTIAPVVLAGGTNTHSTTTYVYSCLACHPSNQHAAGPADAVAPKQDATVSGTKVTGYTKGITPIVDGKGFNATNGTCTTVCHTKDGVTLGSAIVAQNWGTAATDTCGVCHNKAGDATPVWTASHNKHITSYSANTNISCASCHVGTAASNTALQATAAARNQHPNANRDVAMNAFAAGGAVVIGGSQGSQTCSNTYCHSNGTLVAGTHTAISWSGTTSCASCHAALPASGAHAKHLATSTSAGAITCNRCHNVTASSNTIISNFANHVDKTITIALDATSSGATGTYAGSVVGGGSSTSKLPGSAAGTCNTTNCHGGNSQSWTTVNTNATCVKCHGVSVTTPAAYLLDINTAAPGYNGMGVNTSGLVGAITNSVSANPKVGAHNAHLKGANNYKTGGVACNDCHAVTVLSDAGHMNGIGTMTWSNLAQNIGTTPYNADKGAIVPTYTSATGDCAANYCHGGGFSAAVVGTDLTPTWNNTTYITNNASIKNSIDCNKCHASPPIASAKANHSSMVITDDCSGCHGHNGSSPLHIDGILQGEGGTCNTCHDYDVDATGDWGQKPKATEGWGAHATHINHLKIVSGVTLSAVADSFGSANFNAVCGVCHTRNGSNHAMGGTPNTRTIDFGGVTTYVFSTGTPTYKGVTGVSSAITPKTCSNISCHYQTSPVWQGF